MCLSSAGLCGPAAEGGRNAYAGVVMGSQSGTPVAAQRIWQEHVTKELKFQTIRADYTRNPATVDVLPEKPTDLRRELALRRDAAADEERKQMMETLKQKDPRAHADVVGRLQRAEQDPRDRYAYPQTTSQELGWDLAFAKVGTEGNTCTRDGPTRPPATSTLTRVISSMFLSLLAPSWSTSASHRRIPRAYAAASQRRHYSVR